MSILADLIKRHKGLSVCAGAALALTAFVGMYLPLPSQLKVNQTRLVRALASPSVEWSLGDHSRIERVVLADRTELIPEHEEVVEGYVVRLHTRSSVFTIEARPLIVGKTGLYTYFRDKAGVIRFEPEPGKRAGAESRRWNSPLPDDSH